ncbi:hypothetical protein [Dyella sp.]|uniref:hypothetical protein n=1 Tax=Dyella sp. TaxID=1869338 RepID=UPI002ED3B9F3
MKKPNLSGGSSTGTAVRIYDVPFNGNNKNKLMSKIFKGLTCVLFFMFVSSVLVASLMLNPTTEEARIKYACMDREIKSLLSYGGRVVYDKGGSKYGIAFITKGVVRGSMPFDKYKEMVVSPEKRGWVRFDEGEYSYCKHGMVLKIFTEKELYKNNEINLYSITYDYPSIRKCRNINDDTPASSLISSLIKH